MGPDEISPAVEDLLHEGDEDTALASIKGLSRQQLNRWLLLAARKGSTQLINCLMATGANPNTEDDFGYTALMLLAAQGRHEALEKLVNVQGCIINKRTGSMQTALHCAAGKGRVECTDVLLKAGALVNAADDWGETPLINAVKNGSLETVERLINAGANLEMVDLRGFTALMHASCQGHERILQCLLNHGASVKKASRTSALHQAAKFGHLPCTLSLLRAGACASMRDVEMMLPVELAVQTDQADVTHVLLSTGTTVIEERTVMLTAAKCNAVRTIKLLLKRGCSASSCDMQGIPALFWAVLQNNIEVVQNLLLYNCAANCEISRMCLFNTELEEVCSSLGEQNLTPLAVACSKGYVRLIKLLVKFGIPTNCLLKYSHTGVLPLSITASDDEEFNHFYKDLIESQNLILSLKDMCRDTIRKYLKGNLCVQVARLPLPPFVQDFIIPPEIACANS